LYEVESEDILNEAPLFQCISCESRFSFEYPPSELDKISTFVVNNPQQLLPKDSYMGSLDHSSSVNSNVSLPIESFIAGGARHQAVRKNHTVKDPPDFIQVPMVNKESKPKQRAVNEANMISCPKCGALNVNGLAECYSCRVIFERLVGLPLDTTLRAQPSLVRRWKSLLENFDDQVLHDDFIQNCHELDALRFALLKYEEIKTAQGGDFICDQNIAKINGLLLVKLAQSSTLSKTRRGEVSENPRPQWIKYLYWFPYVLSSLLIFWGMISLGNRNLIGVGVALLCMSSGLIVMFKGKISISDFLN
jgi:hypothetical protein